MNNAASWFFGELRTSSMLVCVGLQLIFFIIIYIILPHCMCSYRKLLTAEGRMEISLLLNTNFSLITTGILAWVLWPGSIWNRLANPFELVSSSDTFLIAIDWFVSSTLFDCIIYALGIRRWQWEYIMHHIAFIGCYVDSYFHPCFVLSMWSFYTLETSTLFMNMIWICRYLKVTDQWYYLTIQKIFAFTFVALRNVCTTIYYIYICTIVYKNQVRLEITWCFCYGSLYILNLYWGLLVIMKTARKLGWIKSESNSPQKQKKTQVDSQYAFVNKNQKIE